jgi:hypothetical protein
MRGKAKAAVPSLIEALQDNDAEVRNSDEVSGKNRLIQLLEGTQSDLLVCFSDPVE